MFSAGKFFLARVGDVLWDQLGSMIIGKDVDQVTGTSLSLNADGGVVAVGAPGRPVAETNGRARVYARNGSAWVQRGADIVGKYFGDDNGCSVSINGDGTVLAVGARVALPTQTETGKGLVRVFVWNGSAWVQRGADIVGDQADNAGTSVGLSSDGGVVAVGCPGANGLLGCVRVYAWSGSAWVQRGGTIAPVVSSQAEFGTVLSLSADGNVVACGAHLQSDSAMVYAWSGSAWVQRGGTFSGSEGVVAISGNGLVLCLLDRVFVWNGSSWVQRGSRLPLVRSQFSGLAMGGISAVNADGTALCFKIYDGGSDKYGIEYYLWSGSAWSKRGGTFMVPVPEGSNGFDIGVCGLSPDGLVMALSDPYIYAWRGGVNVYGRR